MVDIRKDVDGQMILNYLYKNTDLQIYYNYNNVAIVDQRPVQIGLIGLLDAFIDFRKEVVTRRAQFEKDRMEERCHIIEGLMKAVSILDEVIALIRASKDKADAKKNLMARFGFDEPAGGSHCHIASVPFVQYRYHTVKSGVCGTDKQD